VIAVADANDTPHMSTTPATVGPVRLEIPPSTSMSRIVRLNAIGVASMAGFTIDEIDDVNVMVSEVMVALVEHGARSAIAISFEVVDGCFTVRGTTEFVNFDFDHPDLALCRTVLAAVSTSHGIAGTSERVEIWASLQQQPL
jgi:anti-sigma regulatory factor (Ser/Thr protein kinase)